MTEPVRHVVVIGGGISGLAAAHRLAGRAAAVDLPLEVTLLEASERLGGWIRTESFAGRPVDFGPDSLLVRMPWARELAREVGMDDELVAPGEGGAFLLSRGKLRPLPAGILAGLPGGPLPFVRSGLLGPLGLLRAGLDLILPANAPAGDESIGHLIRRRLGRQTLERVIDPLLGGVHAGRCDDLSLAATAPQIAAAARADRSLLRGLRKTAPPVPAAGAPRAPVFMAPRGGMQPFAEAIIRAIRDAGVKVRTGARVDAIEPGDNATLTLRLASGGVIEADGVILAVPAATAAGLIAPHAVTAASTLGALAYASVAHTALAYDPSSLPAELPAGTGFLVPRPERRLMTACTFLDRKWPQRRAVAEEQGTGDDLAHAVVIKCSTGRIDDARFERLTDEDLVNALHRELAEILGLTAPPIASRVVRVSGGLPQYAPGHPERIAAATTEVAEALPALSLAGAAYRGASVPLCIRDGRAAADAQLIRLGLTAARDEIARS
ncbi:MAG: protoporphyrinogen oxidase [Solirubrobacteraceae bacterium]|nr:protoporphyrinogen oxidase [Solirubrobacteraceae bacterium]